MKEEETRILFNKYSYFKSIVFNEPFFNMTDDNDMFITHYLMNIVCDIDYEKDNIHKLYRRFRLDRSIILNKFVIQRRDIKKKEYRRLLNPLFCPDIQNCIIEYIYIEQFVTK